MVDIPLLTRVLPPSQEDMNHLPSIHLKKGTNLLLVLGNVSCAEKFWWCWARWGRALRLTLLFFLPSNQLMVKLLIWGHLWFGFLGSLLRGTPRITNHQLRISWSSRWLTTWMPKTSKSHFERASKCCKKTQEGRRLSNSIGLLRLFLEVVGWFLGSSTYSP